MQNSDARVAFIKRLEKLIDEDPDEALQRIVKAFDDTPDDPALLFLAANIFAKADHHGFALHLYKRVTEMAPQRAEGWNNYGMALTGIGRFGEAREAFLNAKKRAEPNKPHEHANYVANVGLTWMEQGERAKAIEWAEKALKIDPECKGAKQTIGFCSLALGDWKRGWEGYATALGGKFRRIVKIGNEPEWQGQRVGTLFVYGEQGIGDELQMATCLEDAKRDCDTLIVECDKRLQGLFRRSFPFADVYGTRKVKEVSWPTKYKIDAGVAIGDLPKFYRPSPAACPGTPFLTADPERRTMWRALLRQSGKPVIGLAWSGGRKHTNAAGRSFGLEAFRPLIEKVDAHYVCLQYKDAQAEIDASGLPVRQYGFATLTDDYDDTAALVAELDCVVSTVTAVIHLAGGLGVPATVLRPIKRTWNVEGERNYWHASLDYFDQRPGEHWKQTIGRLAADFHRLRPEATSRVQRLAALDRTACVGARVDHPADLAAVAD